MFARKYQDQVYNHLHPDLQNDSDALFLHALEGLRYRMGKLDAFVRECQLRGEPVKRGRAGFEMGDMLQHLTEMAESLDLALGTIMHWNLGDLRKHSANYAPPSREPGSHIPAWAEAFDPAYEHSDVEAWLADVFADLYSDESGGSEDERFAALYALRALADPTYPGSDVLMNLIMDRRAAMLADQSTQKKENVHGDSDR